MGEVAEDFDKTLQAAQRRMGDAALMGGDVVDIFRSLASQVLQVGTEFTMALIGKVPDDVEVQQNMVMDLLQTSVDGIKSTWEEINVLVDAEPITNFLKAMQDAADQVNSDFGTRGDPPTGSPDGDAGEDGN